MMWKILPFAAALFVVVLGIVPPGGIQDIDPKSPDLQRAAQFAVFQYNSKSYHKHMYKMDKVIKSQSQALVVEGVKYIMTLELGKTFCSKDSHKKFCPIIRSPLEATFIICYFTVTDTPSHGGMSLTDSKCQEKNPLD